MAELNELCGPQGQSVVSGNQKVLVVREVGFCGSGRWEAVGHVQAFTPPSRTKRTQTYTEYGTDEVELTIRSGIDEGELGATVTLYKSDEMIFQLEKDFETDINWNYAYVIGGRYAYPFVGYISGWQWSQDVNAPVAAQVTWDIERKLPKFQFL